MNILPTRRPGNPTAKLVFAYLLIMFCLGKPLCAQIASEASGIFQQASAAMQRGDLNAAGDDFAAATKAAPAFAEAHFNLGLVREEQGRFDEAIVSFQKALALKPRLHGANLFLGIAYFRLNQLDKAFAAIQKKSASYPKDAPAWMWQGVVRLAQDEPEEAAEALDKAATLAPDDMDILYHPGRAHLLGSQN